MIFTKLRIAEIQLEKALYLFFNEKDFISSITLAGAADEIFGKLRELNGESNSYNELKKLFKYVYTNISRKTPSDKEFNLLANGIRNGLKHLGDNNTMDFEPDQEAANIIDRAIENYFALTGEESKLMEKFKHYSMRPSYSIPDD